MNPTRWPRTLFSRLTLILFIGLAAAHAMSYWLIISERREATTNLMLGYLEQDVASSVALLDHLPAGERGAWLPRLERRGYTFSLGSGDAGHAPDSELSKRVAASFVKSIGKHYPVTAGAVPGHPNRVQALFTLGDGTKLVIDMRPSGLPIPVWLPAVLLLQLALLAVVTWYAVRLATRPLAQLAAADDRLGPDLQAAPVAEGGPLEVARAARAFNAMQNRILNSRGQV